MVLGWNLKLQKHSTAAKHMGCGKGRLKFASWFCHLLAEWLWTGFWLFCASLFSSGNEGSNSTNHIQLMWSYMSYYNAERLPCDCPFSYHRSPPLHQFIPSAYTHAVCGGSLEKVSLVKHPPVLTLFLFSHLHQNSWEVLIHSSQTLIFCYSNETAHQHHPWPPFCLI